MLFLVRFSAFHWFVYDFIVLFVFKIMCFDFEYVFKIFHSLWGEELREAAHTFLNTLCLKNDF